MPDDIQIKLVHAEILRAGPPHNQLLSPLTQYLAIAGDAGAGVVTVPYEHAEFERRLKELRYETGDAGDRQAMLHTTGVEMGRILGAVPGLAGALAVDPRQRGTMVQLRLTLSASELALLPFELAKVPVSATVTAENWLSIRSRPPVCVTRNIRTVSAEGVLWPTRPRILFITGDTDDVPYTEHRDALLRAIAPFRYPGRDENMEPPRQPPRTVRRAADDSDRSHAVRRAGRVPPQPIHARPHPHAWRSQRDRPRFVRPGVPGRGRRPRGGLGRTVRQRADFGRQRRDPPADGGDGVEL